MKILDRYSSKSPKETEQAAEILAGIFKEGDIVLLEGDLGSGKTFLVKALCKIWQTEDEAVSPTFTILNHYSGRMQVNHFDLYRIQEERELDQLGWEEIIDGGGVTFIEWPQMLEKHLEYYYKLKIEMQDGERIISLLEK